MASKEGKAAGKAKGFVSSAFSASTALSLFTSSRYMPRNFFFHT